MEKRRSLNRSLRSTNSHQNASDLNASQSESAVSETVDQQLDDNFQLNQALIRYQTEIEIKARTLKDHSADFNITL